jgi:opacity protein-like surface antigen
MNYEPKRNGASFMRKTIIVAAFSILTFGLCAGIAGAQVPTSGNVYFGYTYYNTDLAPTRGGLNGWQGTLEGKLLPLLGIVADVTGQYGSLDLGQICPVVPVGGGGGGCSTFNLTTHEYNVLFGPRVGMTIGKFRPFGEFEIGVAHVSASTVSNTTFATAVGGGMDYKIFHAVAWRVEGDYVHTHFFSAGQNNVRVSTGLVLRF